MKTLRYRYAGDLQDVTEQVSRGTASEKQYGQRIVVPKGHVMTFVYLRDPSEQASGVSTVKRMLDEYAQLGGPSFILKQDGARLFVQPHLVKDVRGNQVEEGSVLDTLITLPARQWTGEELLGAICTGVAAKSGFQIDVGSNAPSNLLRDYRTEDAFINQPAKHVLAHLLDGLSKRQVYVWDLYYDPSDGGYVLNFAYVEKP